MSHYCNILQNGAPEFEVRFCEGARIDERIQEFKLQPGEVASLDQRSIERYAEASYLRHASYFDSYAQAADPVLDWIQKRRAHQEAIILMESWLPNMFEKPNSLLGVLLLRSGWSRDISIDYVVTNKRIAQRTNIRETGRKLVNVALRFAKGHSAPLVWVETAKESTHWWRFINPKNKTQDFLTEGEDFIRYSEVVAASKVMDLHLQGSGVHFVYANG